MNQIELQSAIVGLLNSRGPMPLMNLIHPNVNEQTRRLVEELTDAPCTADAAEFNEAIWALIARKLAWIDTHQHQSANWVVHLTERGHAAAATGITNPDDPSEYMRRILTDAPATSDVVQMYLRESLRCFDEECYIASAVMLGVAAEACMLETANAFVGWLGSSAGKLKAILKNPRTFYVAKLEEFQKRLSVAKSSLPPELSDNLDLDVTAVIQLIRLTRNDAGHPTGRKINHEDAFNHLVIYARVHKRLHGLIAFFNA